MAWTTRSREYDRGGGAGGRALWSTAAAAGAVERAWSASSAAIMSLNHALVALTSSSRSSTSSLSEWLSGTSIGIVRGESIIWSCPPTNRTLLYGEATTGGAAVTGSAAAGRRRPGELVVVVVVTMFSGWMEL